MSREPQAVANWLTINNKSVCLNVTISHQQHFLPPAHYQKNSLENGNGFLYNPIELHCHATFYSADFKYICLCHLLFTHNCYV